MKRPIYNWPYPRTRDQLVHAVMTGIDPVALTEYAVIFSVLILPLTYFPILKMAGNKRMMGKHVNGRFAKTLGWSYFVVVCAVSVAAVPLMILTGRGQ